MYAFVTRTLMLFFLFHATSGHCVQLKKIERRLSDSMITAKLTAKYTENVRLNPLKIFVSTTHGCVTLKGHVRDKQAFVDALRLAKSTKGVQSVDAEQLEIKRVNTVFTDAYITAKVETAILKAKVLDDESIPLVGINATTKNGTVILTGNVKNRKDISLIINRIKTVRGVKTVNSKLKVI